MGSVIPVLLMSSTKIPLISLRFCTFTLLGSIECVQPHFATRSELLDARKHDRKQLALDLTHDSRCFDKKFARSETIFRDSFRKSGAFDRAEQPALDPHQFHPRATCSGLLTRTAVLEKRCEDRNVANLKFEPQEIERFKDIPNADQLTNWWKLRDGYVEDPSSFCGNSLRLEMAKHGFALGPMDPAKVRCPASVSHCWIACFDAASPLPLRL